MVKNASDVTCDVLSEESHLNAVSGSRLLGMLPKEDCLAPDKSCRECDLREDCTDSELVEACRKGYRRAQHQLYETYRQRVHALMMRMIGNQEEASDLAQDAFLRVFNRIGDFRGESALGTWIHRVAVNEALQHLRRKRRYQKVTEAIAEDPRRLDLHTEDPDVSLDVNSALNRLPERMRQMVLMRYHDGLDYSEIARHLGVKQGTVASGLNRARQQLREILQ
jgi:RNA polymerase sigma-70 factor, ECF subfamily